MTLAGLWFDIGGHFELVILEGSDLQVFDSAMFAGTLQVCKDAVFLLFQQDTGYEIAFLVRY